MRDYLLGLRYRMLQGPRAQRLLGVFGAEADTFRDQVAYGVKQTMIEECDVGAYGAHLRNSGLIAVRAEPTAATLAALRGRWLTARQQGGVEGMLAVLARVGFPGCQVVTQLDLYLAGNLTAFGNLQGFFYVDVPVTAGFGNAFAWDDGTLWDAGPEWDLQEPYTGALGDLVYVIQKTKHACSSCRYLLIHLPDGSTATVPVWERWERLPDGSYGDKYNTGY